MTFDPSTFMSQTIDKPLSTEFANVPPGEYHAMIEVGDADKAFRTFDRKDSNGNVTGTGTTFSPGFVIQDAKVQADLGRDRVLVFHKGVFLDFDDAGNLDTSKGKNVGLGQLREAAGQNQMSGWNISMLNGAGPVLVKVVHEKDKNNPDNIYVRVNKVAKIS